MRFANVQARFPFMDFVLPWLQHGITTAPPCNVVHAMVACHTNVIAVIICAAIHGLLACVAYRPWEKSLSFCNFLHRQFPTATHGCCTSKLSKACSPEVGRWAASGWRMLNLDGRGDDPYGIGCPTNLGNSLKVRWRKKEKRCIDGRSLRTEKRQREHKFGVSLACATVTGPTWIAKALLSSPPLCGFVPVKIRCFPDLG
ncbi:hypothetical protein GOP47_0009227 [Adiantum capillus-veneris]|uniref:Uncharacterized protein n=1 Tax=Adiantum capillus-veneris TaxID=13818 RepID=A0A9D4UWC1_ADICA|nr:hypothetical protein GOP47_0009227 [Adiantum capillus-veneris]